MLKFIRFLEIAFFALMLSLFATIAFGVVSIFACRAANTMCIVWHPEVP